MKELSIEEKAKRYDEALEKARQLYAYPTSKPFISDLQDLFPELMEGENERMKKIISDILLIDSDKIREILDANNVLMQDIDAWLEAQGEQRFIKEHDVCDTCEEKASCVIPCPMKLVGQKPTDWSEDDENNINSIVSRLEVDISYWESRSKTRTNEDKKLIEWLKFLKDRYTWKPSDEQMNTLNEVLNFAANHESPHWNDYIFGTLNNLIRQLKKLKE